MLILDRISVPLSIAVDISDNTQNVNSNARRDRNLVYADTGKTHTHAALNIQHQISNSDNFSLFIYFQGAYIFHYEIDDARLPISDSNIFCSRTGKTRPDVKSHVKHASFTAYI